MTIYPPLGAYEPLSLLGRGGMAEVFHVRHKLIGSEFALKRMRPELAAEPRLLALFEQELKALVKLRDPHVVEVHDVFTAEDGAPVIVMELLAAPTLRKRIEERPLSLRELLDLAHSVASGLFHAHRAGIVHCDLKPDNVLLPDGKPARAKIIDFGIAHLSRARDRSTRIGTVPYMAPEQLEDKDVDARTDLFAFGVMLFEAMEGKLPVDQPSLDETITAWRRFEPVFTKDAPRDLRELCKTLLSFDAAGRPRDAEQVLHRLKYIESTQRAFVDSSWNRRAPTSPAPVLAGSLALVFGSVALIAWLVGRKPQHHPVPAHVADTLVVDPTFVPLKSVHPRHRHAAAVAPKPPSLEAERPPLPAQNLDESEDLNDPEGEDEALAGD